MNIVLIGYRGTGKTIISRALARETGRPVISTDTQIEEELAMPISDFVAAHGWSAFRDKETEVLLEALKSSDAIIDTGGGAILRADNRDALAGAGHIVWLTATVENIKQRIASDGNRPSLTGNAAAEDEVETVLAQREHYYRTMADQVISTDEFDVGKVVHTIVAALPQGQ